MSKRFIASDELVQKIVPKSYAIESGSKAGRHVGERILLAVDVIGGTQARLNRPTGFNDFNLFEGESFLEELAESISYEGANPTNDGYFLEIVDLVKRDLYQYIKQNEVKYYWGSVKASNSGDVIVSPPNKP